MSDFAADHAKLLKDYRELAEGVRMVRRAAERACRAGLLPTIEPSGVTPLQDCEAIARAIYRSVIAPDREHAPPALTGLRPDNFPK